MSVIALFLLLALGLLALAVMALFFLAFWLIYVRVTKARRERQQPPVA